MADWEKQAKLRKLQEAKMEELPVSDRAKSLGTGCFLIGLLIAAVFFGMLAVGLLVQHVWLGGILLSIFSVGLLWIVWNLWRAKGNDQFE
ncbi:hypothetical protein [Paenisporosarcina cavernae]|uniref:Uncharacterized protein n=1 Tax=Paenisporosarcina cavernae TaxID=2320858 RepID=A0A385YQL4_9BACL|nr:hypothetical protein [Paenisporosarcina cavernae]AYC28771.1 hypothetical protein D3873_02375 [Paenisporosarcina cavernae]